MQKRDRRVHGRGPWTVGILAVLLAILGWLGLAYWQRLAEERAEHERLVAEVTQLLNMPVSEGPESHPIYVAGLPYRQWLMDGEFSRLDAEAERLLESRELLPGGATRLNALFSGVAMCGYASCPDEDGDDEAWDAVRRQLDQWVLAGSELARIARADFELNLAWRARGHARYAGLSAGALDVFAEHVVVAETLWADIPTSAQRWPTYSMLFINLAKVGRRWSKDDAVSRFEWARNAFPGHIDFYHARGDLSLERWGGDPGEFEAFVESSIEALGDDPLANILYSRMHWASRSFREHSMLKAHWPRMRESFLADLNRFPDDWKLNKFGYATCLAGSVDDLQTTMLSMKGGYRVLWRGNYEKCLELLIHHRYGDAIVAEARARLGAQSDAP